MDAPGPRGEVGEAGNAGGGSGAGTGSGMGRGRRGEAVPHPEGGFTVWIVSQV